ncbi:hypothetical protein AMECASPLE_014370 [Ameca splendens]|uniref:Uncharacterized protein n=1 Tax=Ameca splendens TaxID=208324 RepID=A0ABV0YZS4_9TELE
MAALMGHGDSTSHSSVPSHPWMFFLWALSTLLSQVCCFNLDTTHTLHKLGDRGTFFGFSVALHQQLNPEPQSCAARAWTKAQWEAGSELSRILLCGLHAH